MAVFGKADFAKGSRRFCQFLSLCMLFPCRRKEMLLLSKLVTVCAAGFQTVTLLTRILLKCRFLNWSYRIVIHQVTRILLKCRFLSLSYRIVTHQGRTQESAFLSSSTGDSYAMGPFHLICKPFPRISVMRTPSLLI